MLQLFKYYGGKSWFVNNYMYLINDTPHKIFVEPFLGSGKVLLNKRKSDLEVANDTNCLITTLLSVLKYDKKSNELEELVSIRKSELLHKLSKMVLKNKESFSDVEVSWALIYNQYYSFGGTMDGGYSYPKKERARTNEISNISKLSKRLKKVEIFNRDALDVIQMFDSKDTLFFIDPPYIGADQGHYSGYTEGDFIKLLELLSNLKGKFILTHYENNIISSYELKNHWFRIEKEIIKANSSVKNGKKDKVKEIIVMNYNFENIRTNNLFNSEKIV